MCSGLLYAQAPVVGSPVSIELGFGGGVSLPNGKLSDFNETGYHAGAKARFKSVMPLNIVASANYNRLPEKGTDKTDSQWMLGAGLEYPLPGVAVSPYLGVDAMLNLFDNQGTGTSSFSRVGVGMGAGVLFALPGLGSFDTSVKYQLMNVIGKETGEDTFSQIAANVSLMFNLL
jgi:hypothetical protein